MYKVKKVQSAKVDINQLLSDKKRNMEWSEEDSSSAKELCKGKDSDKGYYTWTAKEEHPEYLKTLTRVVKSSFELNDSELDGVVIHLCLPASKLDMKKETTIPKASIATACRVVGCMGTKEILNITILDPKKEEKVLATEKLLMSKDQMIMLPFGSASVANITYNDGRSDVFRMKSTSTRDTKVSKCPDRRFVFVMDFVVSMSSIMNVITKYAGKERMNDEKTQKLVSDVERAVKELKGETVVESSTQTSN